MEKIIVFNTYFKNTGVKVYIEDTLFYKGQIHNDNPKVVELAYTLVVPSESDNVQIKAGFFNKKSYSFGSYKFAYVSRRKFWGKLSVELSEKRRKYR